MRKAVVLACLWAALLAVSLGGLAGCATLRPADQGPSIEQTLARAEFALEAAELALAMWDAQAVAHPNIDRWPEERAKLAEAVREARRVVEMLQALTTNNADDADREKSARLEPGGPRGRAAVAVAGTGLLRFARNDGMGCHDGEEAQAGEGAQAGGMAGCLMVAGLARAGA